jgi:hypothetical protein
MKRKWMIVPLLLVTLVAWEGKKELPGMIPSAPEKTKEAAETTFHVRFQNYNGIALYKTEVAAGGTAVYGGTTPTKPDIGSHSYVYAGWDKDPTAITIQGDTVFTAKYTETDRVLHVNFQNWDGTMLAQGVEVAYGETAVFDGEDPKRDSDRQYQYIFKGWDLPLENVTHDTVYTAVYTATVKKYAVSFRNWNGDDLGSAECEFGGSVTYPGATPAREADHGYTYTFKGWDLPLDHITDYATRIAQYTASANEFTVTFKNWDGTVLSTQDVPYGSLVTYTGAAPTRVSSAGYTYSFSGWDRDLSKPITDDVTITAYYEEVTRQYTVTFKNWDGTEILSKAFDYNTFVSYDGAVPTREDDTGNVYAFADWDSSILSCRVYHDMTFTATYTVTGSKDDSFLYQLLEGGESYAINGFVAGKMMTDIYLPASYNGLPVTAVSNNATDNGMTAADKDAVRSITFPDSITTIGTNAFDHCQKTQAIHFSATSNLETISTNAFPNFYKVASFYVPAKVTHLGENFISNTSACALTEFQVDPANTVYSSEDGVIYSKDKTALLAYPLGKEGAFTIPSTVKTLGGLVNDFGGTGTQIFNYSMLTQITIPSSVQKVGDAFFNAGHLQGLVIPKTVTSIGSLANCDALKVVSFEAGSPITELPAHFANNCQNLSEVRLPSGLLSIGDYAFDHDSALSSITLPSTLKTIGARAFWRSGLTEIEIPDSVTGIGESAFRECAKLTAMSLDPENSLLTSLGSYSFRDNPKLPTVVIPKGITDITTDSPFFGDIALTSFTVASGNTVLQSIAGVVYSKDGKTLIAVPSGLTSFEVPATVEILGTGAFTVGNTLTSVTFAAGSHLTTIQSDAFGYLYGLTSLTLPQSVTDIGSSAFSNVKSLTSIDLESGNTAFSAADGVLFNADKTKLLALPAGKTGDYTVPDSVTELGGYSCFSCSLSSLTLPSTLTRIDSSAFLMNGHLDGLSNLPYLIVPDSVTTIESDAFGIPVYLKATEAKAGYSSIMMGNDSKAYYYSETVKDGAHWHYDTDGKTPIVEIA